MYAPVMQHLKLEIGTDIVVHVTTVEQKKSSQHASYDYRVTGELDSGIVDFYVFGSAMERQAARLSFATPAAMCGFTMLFRKKSTEGKRIYIDVEMTELPPGLYQSDTGEAIEMEAPRVAPTPRASAKKPANTPPARIGPSVQVATPPARAAIGDPGPVPPPEHQRTKSRSTSATVASTDVAAVESEEEVCARREKSASDRFRRALKTESTNASNIYAVSMQNAIAISKASGVAFTTSDLCAMAATIMIETGKRIRGDKY